ncbi:nitrogen fixation protein FixH [Aliishimia ponticola]|uniref:Nitrogen fixation protein FixH n=1 Tax=Aliishimia ponticola TaxID=2499833 RepID=A0A4S4NBL6_9RHOB|nr:FixH family protein [Aliishimia ponticola]THH35857.1 nitrogen fixation protein FixH [Aliishimia ponticola]
MARQITGWHVLAIFVVGFGIIIAVNLTLAFQAVRTFPGLEVKNSYVASQSFDADRAAQLALGWDAAARVEGETLTLSFLRDGVPVQPVIEKAVFGRATTVAQDQEPAFAWDGAAFAAPVEIAPGNWNLRVEARAADGTLFKQRIIVEVAK